MFVTSAGKGEIVRLVILTRGGFEHRYVANYLSSMFKIEAIIVDEGVPRSRLAQLRNLRRRYTMTQALNRLCVNILWIVLNERERRQAELQRVLGSECIEFVHPHLVRRVRGVNTNRTREMLQSLAPDVLLVYGTGIVKRPVLDSARVVALNMHTGMSPEYRGTDCAFWPLVNNELGLVGATVHECTMQVDGGPIYRRAPVKVGPDDGRWSLFAKSVRLGAQLYAETIADLLADRLVGTPQPPTRRGPYRSVDRGIRVEVLAAWRLRTGLVSKHLRKLEE